MDDITKDVHLDKNIQEKNSILDNMTLLDDELMSKVFDENIPAVELLLHTILDRDDIRVKKAVGQRELKSPVIGGRDIIIDILAECEGGREADIEVQRKKSGAIPRRARLHSSVMDSRMMNSGQEFSELKDSYTIFITEKDYMNAGKPVYHVERIVQETGIEFQDGSYIIYVNASYYGNDPIGKLMHDFRCQSSYEMNYKELADGVHHFKETAEGREKMSDAVEAYAERRAKEAAEEAAKEAAKEIANKMLEMLQSLMSKKHLSFDEAAELLDLSDENRKMIKSIM